MKDIRFFIKNTLKDGCIKASGVDGLVMNYNCSK